MGILLGRDDTFFGWRRSGPQPQPQPQPHPPQQPQAQPEAQPEPHDTAKSDEK